MLRWPGTLSATTDKSHSHPRRSQTKLKAAIQRFRTLFTGCSHNAALKSFLSLCSLSALSFL